MGDIEQAPGLAVRHVGAIAEIEGSHWDRCAGAENPFVSHAFLKALEDSGSAAADQGWEPRHLVAAGADGVPVAVAPAYMKSHSYGEYVFDHGWAEAFERAGGRYYPKLQIAVPFTPVPGPRLLVRPDQDPGATARALLAGAVEAARSAGASSLHVTFCTEAEWRLMGAAGLLQRTGEQFHWRNHGYATFDDFLAALTSRKRKAIRSERRQALADGEIEIEVLEGADITEAHWDAFFAFYLDTGRRKWGSPYLNREFFSLLGQTMAAQVVLVMASRAGRPIAGALNLLGADALFGRYWGCTESHRSLHFEVCYYRAIEFAIGRGLARVEAGAQGPHKLSRGYVPVRTFSGHWIRDPGLRQAVADFLVHERDQVDDEIGALSGHAPFRRGAM